MARCQRVKSNTHTITGALDTFHLPDREDGICEYCGEYNSELGLDNCCVDDRHAHPHTLTCFKARKLRALANAEAIGRGEIEAKDINPLEGLAWMVEGTILWQKMI